MLQTANVTAFIVSKLLSENEMGWELGNLLNTSELWYNFTSVGIKNSFANIDIQKSLKTKTIGSIDLIIMMNYLQ